MIRIYESSCTCDGFARKWTRIFKARPVGPDMSGASLVRAEYGQGVQGWKVEVPRETSKPVLHELIEVSKWICKTKQGRTKQRCLFSTPVVQFQLISSELSQDSNEHVGSSQVQRDAATVVPHHKVLQSESAQR